MRQKEEPNRQAAPAADEQEASQGFLSYAHADDDALGGVITRLHQELERKVRAVMGKSFPIFLDHDGIEFGQHWPDRLEEALAGARFLIPILTPSYFTSDFCRQEAETFLEYEAEAGRKDLILPIYLIEADVLDNKQLRDADPLAKRLAERQYADWRHLAVLPADDPQLAAEVMGLARAIKKAAQRPDRPRKAPPKETKKPVPEDLLTKLESNDPIDRLGAWVAFNDRAVGDPPHSATLIEAVRTRRNGEHDTRVLKLMDEITGTDSRSPGAAENENKPQVSTSGIRGVHVAVAAVLSLAAGALIAWWSLQNNERTAAIEDRTADQLNINTEQLAELQATIAQQRREIEELKSGAARSSEELATTEGQLAEARADAERLQGELRNQSDVAERIVVLEEQILRRDATIGELRSESEQFNTTIGALKASRADSDAELARIDEQKAQIASLEQELDRAKSAQSAAEAQLLEAQGETQASQGEVPDAARDSGIEPGDTFRDCQECPEMVVIPAGTFLMGSPENEVGRNDIEGPQREVTIGQHFALGKYEVTFAEWDACVAVGDCSHQPGDQGWGRGNQPVIDVNWEEAQAYVSWLSKKSGERYRLPSEAEWEYAARSGATTAYWWGSGLRRGQANCDGCGSEWDDKQTAPVGSFAANEFGLHDTAGNVSEWVEDCWNVSYEGAPSDGTAWLQGDCSARHIRGGHWGAPPEELRSAGRAVDRVDTWSNRTGFRVARML